MLRWLEDLIAGQRQTPVQPPSADPEPQTLPAVVVTPSTPVSQFAFKIEDCRREQFPRFKRTYKTVIDGRWRLEIEYALNILNGRKRECSLGYITQSNGRYIYFEPHRIADKIIDPVLVPLLEDACREIAGLDAEYWANKPDSFIDETGQKWVRA